MRGGSFGDVLTGLVFVALATTIVAHKNTAGDISAAGNRVQRLDQGRYGKLTRGGCRPLD